MFKKRFLAALMSCFILSSVPLRASECGVSIAAATMSATLGGLLAGFEAYMIRDYRKNREQIEGLDILLHTKTVLLAGLAGWSAYLCIEAAQETC